MESQIEIQIQPGRLPIPYSHSRYLFYSSFIFGICCAAPIYQSDYSSFLFTFIIFLTSINYWYKPDYGFRRNIDLFFCKLINFYFYMRTLLLKDEFTLAVHTNGMITVMTLYFLEHVYIYFNSKKWILFHMAIHINFFMIPFICYIL
jgi:hypothetical protein